MLVVGACGGTADGGDDPVASVDGTSSDGTDGTNADNGKTDEEKALEFADCMREHGVPMEDPKPGKDGKRPRITIKSEKGKGPSRATLEKAMEACRALAPGDGKPHKPSKEELEEMRTFAACMREHGVPMEDPKADGGPMLHRFQDDDKTEKALEACAELQPGARGETNGSSA